MHRSRLERKILNASPSPNPVVLFYPTELVPPSSSRFPMEMLPGATLDFDEVTEISLPDIMVGSTTADALLDALHKQILTARTT